MSELLFMEREYASRTGSSSSIHPGPDLVNFDLQFAKIRGLLNFSGDPGSYIL